MADATYRQIVRSVVRQSTRPAARTGTACQCQRRTGATLTAAHETDGNTTALRSWTQHSAPAPVHGRQPRLKKLKQDTEPRPFSSFLTDNYAREHNYLRISVTERCNLRCVYCMPEEGVPLSPPEHNLSTPEIVYLSELFVKQGVDKIRLTGGEPTVRKDIVDLVHQIGQLRSQGLKELCITTNGISLHRKLDSMVESGLTAVNLSLDTLDPFQFTLMTRRNGHDAVMKSINRILEMNRMGAGIKLKINCVVMRGINEREILPFVAMGRERDLEVRFIEYMPFDGNKWSKNKMLSYQEMLALIRTQYPTVHRVQDHKNDTSKTYQVPGFIGRIGFITSMTHNFCGTCNRLRITSDGNLKVCLFGNNEVSLRDVLRESNAGKVLDEPAMMALRQRELDSQRQLTGLPESADGSQHASRLLDVIGMAVKRKKEKHAGIGELEKMKNRPMILIDEFDHVRRSGPGGPSTSPRRISFRPDSKGLPFHTTPHAIPFHLLSHPRSSMQMRFKSTYLSRRTYSKKKSVRYYVHDNLIRPVAYDRPADVPKFLKSHKMTRMIRTIKHRLLLSHRHLGFLSQSLHGDHRKVTSTWQPEMAVDRQPVQQSAPTIESAPRQPLSHLDERGQARMVNISHKSPTTRSACAESVLLFSSDVTLSALTNHTVIKGDAQAVARVAAIQAAKKTPDLIPLAHPSLNITGVTVKIDTFSGEKNQYHEVSTHGDHYRMVRSDFGGVRIVASVECQGQTGVEMEALTAATIGAVTMYDMLKGIDKAMHITRTRVISKTGGKSGDWFYDNDTGRVVHLDASTPPKQHKQVHALEQAQSREGSAPAMSDIDEWNEGLAEEFSAPRSSESCQTRSALPTDTIPSFKPSFTTQVPLQRKERSLDRRMRDYYDPTSPNSRRYKPISARETHENNLVDLEHALARAKTMPSYQSQDEILGSPSPIHGDHDIKATHHSPPGRNALSQSQQHRVDSRDFEARQIRRHELSLAKEEGWLR